MCFCAEIVPGEENAAAAAGTADPSTDGKILCLCPNAADLVPYLMRQKASVS